MTMDDKKSVKKRNFFLCEKCNANFKRKSDYERHLLTAKHQKTENSYKKGQKSTARDFVCECGKTYIRRQNLYSHRKTCVFWKMPRYCGNSIDSGFCCAAWGIPPPASK